MVRRRVSAVSNQEATSRAASFETRAGALLRMRHELIYRDLRPTAIPIMNAIASEPSGASRAMLLSTLSGMPGCRPASIAAFARDAADFSASIASVVLVVR